MIILYIIAHIPLVILIKQTSRIGARRRARVSLRSKGMFLTPSKPCRVVVDYYIRIIVIIITPRSPPATLESFSRSLSSAFSRVPRTVNTP